MNMVWKVLPGIVFGLLLALPLSVSAETISQSAVVTVHATVLPARYIVVDTRGVITSIISNTSDTVTPTVYLGSVVAGNERPLTPELLENYDRIMSSIQATGPGVLYKRPPVAATPARKQQVPQPKVLQLLQKKHG